MKKRMITLVLALAMILSLSVNVFAAAPVVEKTEYEGRGYVEVEFTKKVQYKNVKVTVKNAAGKVMTAVITEKDSDDLTFRVSGVKPGAKYTYTISGVRAGRTGKYQSVTGSFKVPKWDPLIKDIDYDAEDKELEVEFVKRVQYKNLKVTLKDAASAADLHADALCAGFRHRGHDHRCQHLCPDPDRVRRQPRTGCHRLLRGLPVLRLFQ